MPAFLFYMILIFTIAADQDTADVVRWLHRFDADFLRINENDSVQVHYLDLCNNQLVLNINGRYISLEDIDMVWYRKGSLLRNMPFTGNEAFDRYLRQEREKLEAYVALLLEQKPHLGTFLGRHPNKLEVLQAAQNLGLKIPATYICTSSEAIAQVQSNHPMLITKTINHPISLDSQEVWLSMYTQRIDKNTSELPANFGASLVQEGIAKMGDIRVVVFDGVCYGMLVFSQNNEQTQIDFRQIPEGYSHQVTPFQLPKAIEAKVMQLLEQFDIAFASVDLIYSKDKAYYFLEFNPSGQFGMTSIPCNYQLDKKIAQYLINNAKKTN
ncbi:MAG TPA: grasp-with-spasm system ATP-grasp peptide maturase [Saprospiraceae bacterium]|nr:grasp-with-spasm system ATP-grasp peptide maturase [Saprospiraceae bacterium]HMQ85467.1 grasp-with-spasm system ATP-grasp peptide maturase [Saprospiraceae bacterium]